VLTSDSSDDRLLTGERERERERESGGSGDTGDSGDSGDCDTVTR
jgi:hypothetical protein